MKAGIIGAGEIGTRLARHFINIGNSVILCNSRGPETLKDTAASLGPNAAAGTLREAAAQDVIILAVKWDAIPAIMKQIDDWHGKILIDATNQLTMTPQGRRPVAVNPSGSEYIASMAKNARVIKAFNSLFGQFMDGRTGEGSRVLFYAGDDKEAKETLRPLFEKMGFYPVDLGTLAEGGRLMQVGGALNGKHFIKRDEEVCL